MSLPLANRVFRIIEFSQDIADKICELLVVPMSLNEICRATNMPTKQTVFRWLKANDYFRTQYAIARDDQAEAFVDEILEIADDSQNDWMERVRNGRREIVFNDESSRRSQLRIDTRKWAAGKAKPKKYGDKVIAEIGGLDGKPIEHKLTSEELTSSIEGKLASIAASRNQKEIPEQSE